MKYLPNHPRAWVCVSRVGRRSGRAPAADSSATRIRSNAVGAGPPARARAALRERRRTRRTSSCTRTRSRGGLGTFGRNGCGRAGLCDRLWHRVAAADTQPGGCSGIGGVMEPLGRGDPQQVGGFRLVGRLGYGATASVFLGRAPDGTAVAVKTVHPHLSHDHGGFRYRFVREVQAARKVNSPFTPVVLAADPYAHVPWLAIEFVPGIPLSTVVEEFGPLPEASLLALAAGLFTALAEIHAVGLVHRDVKPSNIVLGIEGPKVIDFGVATPDDGTTAGPTETGHTVGTLGFMSPEQFERADVGPKSDVFAAGAVLAWAATGRPAFPGNSLPVLFANLTTRAPDLDGLPASLAPLVEAALAKDPAARPTALAARAMLPAPPVHASAEHGWLAPTVTHAGERKPVGGDRLAGHGLQPRQQHHRGLHHWHRPRPGSHLVGAVQRLRQLGIRRRVEARWLNHGRGPNPTPLTDSFRPAGFRPAGRKAAQAIHSGEHTSTTIAAPPATSPAPASPGPTRS
ncbi:serine/threonine-protein kinase [Embleya scabrispora]|nr:serine/threonine-protein kinase [Embleya scabrispora]